MPVILRYAPSYNALAVYETANAASPADGPMADPKANASVVKFHSGLQYPTLKTQFDAVANLPALEGETIVRPPTTYYRGAYHQGQLSLGSHGQADVPIIKAALVNYGGRSLLPIEGSLIIEQPTGQFVSGTPLAENSRFFRAIEVGIAGSTVYLNYFGYVPAGTRFGGLPSRTLTVRVWVYDWVIDGSPTRYNAAQPLLSFSPTRITVGRGQFDTDYSYIRANTGNENSLFATTATTEIAGTSGEGFAEANWGWRYSVDGWTYQGQTISSSYAAPFKRVKLP